jgi:hypothetical protein
LERLGKILIKEARPCATQAKQNFDEKTECVVSERLGKFVS